MVCQGPALGDVDTVLGIELDVEGVVDGAAGGEADAERVSVWGGRGKRVGLAEEGGGWDGSDGRSVGSGGDAVWQEGDVVEREGRGAGAGWGKEG